MIAKEWSQRQAGAPVAQLQRGRIVSGIIKYAILLFWMMAALMPFIWMWSSAFKTSKEIFRDPFALPSSINIENLLNAWTVGRFGNYIGNSIINY